MENTYSIQRNMPPWIHYLFQQRLVIQTEKTQLSYVQRERMSILGYLQGYAIKGESPLNKTSGHVRCKHSITGEINRKVNSFHKFSINSISKIFKILVRSVGGKIEAIQHESLPVEAWMWYSEMELSSLLNILGD